MTLTLFNSLPLNLPTSLTTAAVVPPSTNPWAPWTKAPTTTTYVVMSLAPRMVAGHPTGMALVDLPISTTTKTTRKSVAEVEDDPRSAIQQLDGQDEICALRGVIDHRGEETSYCLPWGQCTLDPAGNPKPPDKVNHPKLGVGVYEGVSDSEGSLLYYFAETDILSEVAMDPSYLPQTNVSPA